MRRKTKKTRSRSKPLDLRTTIVLSALTLLGLLLLFALLKRVLGWPSDDSEQWIIITIIVISILPSALLLIEFAADQGAVIEYQGIKLSFAQVAVANLSSITIPKNIGVPGSLVPDSGTHEIIKTLKLAVSTDVVVIDLEDGHAWWETRLLVLLAGAVRLGKPNAIVFVGTDRGKERRFQGWAAPSILLKVMLNENLKYREMYCLTQAVAAQWALIEPSQTSANPLEPPPTWLQSEAHDNRWLAFQANLPDEFAPEHLLANKLIEEIENSVNSFKEINLVRLEDIFRPVLQTDCIDETWSSEQQVDTFLSSNASYIAITQDYSYVSLLSRVSGLNAIMRSVVKAQ